MLKHSDMFRAVIRVEPHRVADKRVYVWVFLNESSSSFNLSQLKFPTELDWLVYSRANRAEFK